MGAGLALGTSIAILIREWRMANQPEFRASQLKGHEKALREQIARDQRNIEDPGKCHLRSPQKALESHTAQLAAVQQKMSEPMPVEERLARKIARDREKIADPRICHLRDPHAQLVKHTEKLQDIERRRQAVLPPSPYAQWATP